MERRADVSTVSDTRRKPKELAGFFFISVIMAMIAFSFLSNVTEKLKDEERDRAFDFGTLIQLLSMMVLLIGSLLAMLMFATHWALDSCDELACLRIMFGWHRIAEKLGVDASLTIGSEIKSSTTAGTASVSGASRRKRIAANKTRQVGGNPPESVPASHGTMELQERTSSKMVKIEPPPKEFKINSPLRKPRSAPLCEKDQAPTPQQAVQEAAVEVEHHPPTPQQGTQEVAVEVERHPPTPQQTAQEVTVTVEHQAEARSEDETSPMIRESRPSSSKWSISESDFEIITVEVVEAAAAARELNAAALSSQLPLSADKKK